MNSRELFAAIQEIAATSSKNDKQALVAKHKDDPEFIALLHAALNPYITYGVIKVPERTMPGAGFFREGGDTWGLLNKLATRELTGNVARAAIQDEINRLEDSSAELFIRALRKDLRAGFGESTVNKVIKGLIPTFPYMRCSLPSGSDFETWEDGEVRISQEKADGMFVNIDREPGEVVRLTTRQGTSIPTEFLSTLIHILAVCLADNTQTHGEMLVLDSDGKVSPREIGNGILNSVCNGSAPPIGYQVVIRVWDQIPLSEVKPKGKYSVAYIDRLRGLIAQLRRVPGGSREYLALTESRIVRSKKEALEHYQELLKHGKEGTIVKKSAAIWKDGTSKEQVKLKLEVPVDLKVTGIVPGRVGTKNEGRPGSLTVETSDGELITDIAVKNEAMRDAVEKNPEDWIDRIVTVIFNAIMMPSASNEKHSLFLPRMAEPNYRLDKDEADSLEAVKKQFDNAVGVNNE